MPHIDLRHRLGADVVRDGFRNLVPALRLVCQLRQDDTSSALLRYEGVDKALPLHPRSVLTGGLFLVLAAFKEIRHIIDSGIDGGRLATRRGFTAGFFVWLDGAEEVVDKFRRAAAVISGRLYRSGFRRRLGCRTQLVVGCLDELEEDAEVADLYGGAAQLLVERRVVEEIEILQHQQSGGLIVGMQRYEAPEIVQCLTVHAFRVCYQFGQIHHVVQCELGCKVTKNY